MANPNIASTTTITGSTNVLQVTTSATAIVTNSNASNQLFKIYSLNISNITSSPATITVDLFRSSVAYRIATAITVAGNSTLVVITKDNGIYINEGDSLRLTASSNNVLEAVCSYEVIA